QDREVQLPTECERALEEVDGPTQVSPDTSEVREGQPREAHAQWVIDGFRDLEAVPAVRVSLLEDAALGEAARQAGTTPHRREGGQAKTLSAPVALEQLLESQADALRAVVVARDVAHVRPVVVAGNLERHIVQRLADGFDDLDEPAHFGHRTARHEV